MQITLTDVGPVSKLQIPIPDAGGIVVLRGRNGAGKSTTLAAVAQLTEDRRATLTPRHGAKEGLIEAPGLRLRIGARTTKAGDLAVHQIESSAPAELVDPGIKDPERADAARARALCRILGIEPAVQLWAALLSDPARIVDAMAGADQGDATECAAQVKRYLEAQARAEEHQSERDRSRADVARQAAKDALAGVAEYPGDPQADAVEAAGRIKTLEAAAAAASAAAAKIPGIEAQVAAVSSLSPEAAKLDLDAALARQARAKEALEAAKAELAESISATQRAQDALRLAEAAGPLSRELASLRAAVAKAPAPGALDQAKARLEAARAGMVAQARAADAKARQREAGEMEASADRHAHEAKRLREAAAKVEPLLFSGASSDLVEVRDGLLYGRHSKLGMVRFGSLSHGERWRLALEMVIRRQQRATDAGTPILAVAQEAWEGLDPSNREELAAIAREYRVAIITAEAEAGELAVSQF